MDSERREDERQEGERDREKAEEGREVAEEGRVEAEEVGERSRVEAESGRVDAEGERERQRARRGRASERQASAEKGRETAESDRVDAESERDISEGKRDTQRGHDKTEFYTIYAIIVLLIAGAVWFGADQYDQLQDQNDQLQEQNVKLENQNKQLALLIKAQEREANERRDQQCELFEQDHLDDVNQLRETYKFLVSPSARTSGIYDAIITALPETERRAKRDRAPDYCDEPGQIAEIFGAKPIGLPEPDPVLPKRPPELR